MIRAPSAELLMCSFIDMFLSRVTPSDFTEWKRVREQSSAFKFLSHSWIGKVLFLGERSSSSVLLVFSFRWLELNQYCIFVSVSFRWMMSLGDFIL